MASFSGIRFLFNFKTYGVTTQWLNPAAVALNPLRDSPEAINLQMLYKLFTLHGLLDLYGRTALNR